jgi:hypothetical protein
MSKANMPSKSVSYYEEKIENELKYLLLSNYNLFIPPFVESEIYRVGI